MREGQAMIGPGDERLLEAFVDRAQRGPAIFSEEQLDAGWERLQDPVVGRVPLPGRRPRWRVRVGYAGLASVGAAAVAAIIGYHFVAQDQGVPLSYSVEGAATEQARSITGASNARSRLLFSDESRVDLAAQARLTVDAVDARGAQITLLDGSIDVYVNPRRDAGWTFAAGPFRVKVKGTAFRLEYAAKLGRMSLRMTSGLVEVAGARGLAVPVAAGESLALFAEPTLAARSPIPTSSPPPGEEKSEDQPVPAERPASIASRGSGSPADPSHRRPTARPREEREATPQPVTVAWSKLITQGKFAEIVADAEKRGIDSTLAEGGPADLSSLADAARYTKRHELARRTLLAIRTRFAGTEPARDASFFLGRLGETVPGQAQTALAWYETYVREAPHGLYASEALGREMTLLVPTARERAGKLAKQYLERFPHGSQAELARSLLETGAE
jgi:ferric-dicitrate binding protein FerR (iron transport regulator)